MSDEVELLALEAHASCSLDLMELDQEPSDHRDPSVVYIYW
jgi:hypothetical protein